jgi:signal transduction histidine kinase/CheY-like chemotaxis protein
MGRNLAPLSSFSSQNASLKKALFFEPSKPISLLTWVIEKITNLWKTLSQHLGIRCVFGSESPKEKTIVVPSPPASKKIAVEKPATAASEENTGAASFREASGALQKKKEMFLQMVHDIRSLSHIIFSTSEALADTEGLSIDQQDYVETLKEASGTLSGFIDDSLLLSSFEANKVKLANENFSLSHSFKQIQKTFARACKEKNITLTVSPLPDTLPKWIFADQTKMLRVLMNLISNAIKYNRPGGHVTVKVKYDDITQAKINQGVPIDSYGLVIDIEDTGLGLSKEDQERLFQPYSRSPGTAHIQGTGLGLVVSRLLAQLMQGNITLDSEVGKGSTFTFALQVQKGQKPKHFSSPLDPLLQRKNVRILVAEDNPVNQKIMDRLLKKLHFDNFEFASDGEKALKALKAKTFDVVLMDLQMPEKNGDQATQEYRQFEAQESRKRIPIIALSAEADEETIAKCKKAGMDEFLTKPCNQKSLERTIIKHIMS